MQRKFFWHHFENIDLDGLLFQKEGATSHAAVDWVTLLASSFRSVKTQEGRKLDYADFFLSKYSESRSRIEKRNPVRHRSN